MLVITSLYAGLSSAEDTVTLLLCRLRDTSLKDKMEHKVHKKNKCKSQELVNPIILLGSLQKKDLKLSEYIDHTCHCTQVDSTSVKYVINISIFDSGTLEEWIIFVDLVQKGPSRTEFHCWSTHLASN